MADNLNNLHSADCCFVEVADCFDEKGRKPAGRILNAAAEMMTGKEAGYYRHGSIWEHGSERKMFANVLKADATAIPSQNPLQSFLDDSNLRLRRSDPNAVINKIRLVLNLWARGKGLLKVDFEMRPMVNGRLVDLADIDQADDPVLTVTLGSYIKDRASLVCLPANSNLQRVSVLKPMTLAMLNPEEKLLEDNLTRVKSGGVFQVDPNCHLVIPALWTVEKVGRPLDSYKYPHPAIFRSNKLFLTEFLK